MSRRIFTFICKRNGRPVWSDIDEYVVPVEIIAWAADIDLRSLMFCNVAPAYEQIPTGLVIIGGAQCLARDVVLETEGHAPTTLQYRITYVNETFICKVTKIRYEMPIHYMHCVPAKVFMAANDTFPLQKCMCKLQMVLPLGAVPKLAALIPRDEGRRDNDIMPFNGDSIAITYFVIDGIHVLNTIDCFMNEDFSKCVIDVGCTGYNYVTVQFDMSTGKLTAKMIFQNRIYTYAN